MKVFMDRILLVAFLFANVLASAQFSFGPKAGLVLSTLEIGGSVPIEPENKFSYAVGGFSEYKFSEFSISLDLSYGEYGSKGSTTYYTNELNVSNPDINVKEKMFLIDLAANYYFTDFLSLGGGVYYGSINAVEYDVSGHEKMDVSDKYSKIDLGFVFKVNYVIYKGLFAEFKYNFGLNIIKQNTIDTAPNVVVEHDEVKNRILTISLGYKFR